MAPKKPPMAPKKPPMAPKKPPMAPNKPPMAPNKPPMAPIYLGVFSTVQGTPDPRVVAMLSTSGLLSIARISAICFSR